VKFPYCIKQQHAGGGVVNDLPEQGWKNSRNTFSILILSESRRLMMKVKTRRKIILRTVFGIILILTFAVLSASCQKTEKSTGPKEKVTIGVGSGGLSLPFIIAQEKGFYSIEGLDATIRFYPSGKKALEAMFAGEVDIATSTETPIVLASFARDDFSIFATFAYSYDNSKVIGRKDRGIAKPADLKGKKIGFTAKTSSHFFIHLYLIEHQIDPADVEFVDFAPTDLFGALKDGKVDAVATFEPYASEALKALSGKAVRLPGSNLYRETFNIAVMRNYAKEHPELLKRILKAIDKATKFIKQDRNESIAVMNKSLKLEGNSFVSVQDDLVFELSLDHSLFTIFEDEARWAIKNGLTNKDKIPNYLGYFYLDAMKSIKPEDVTIIK
jgi:NitT/TauT family transport system substrate-binding protein